MTLLCYENLSISFGSGRREKFAVKNLDLEVGIGERVALVGESGSGKTLTALAPLRLEPEGAKVSGKILWNKKDGQGTMLQVNGDKYIGAWKNDLMHGIGIFYDAKEETKK